MFFIFLGASLHGYHFQLLAIYLVAELPATVGASGRCSVSFQLACGDLKAREEQRGFSIACLHSNPGLAWSSPIQGLTFLASKVWREQSSLGSLGQGLHPITICISLNHLFSTLETSCADLCSLELSCNWKLTFLQWTWRDFSQEALCTLSGGFQIFFIFLSGRGGSVVVWYDGDSFCNPSEYAMSRILHPPSKFCCRFAWTWSLSRIK